MYIRQKYFIYIHKKSFTYHFTGLPTVFNIFAHSVPVEERSRAFGYLVASGTAGQTIAALVSKIFLFAYFKWPDLLKILQKILYAVLLARIRN